MELELNLLDWNENELEHELELEDMKRTIDLFSIWKWLSAPKFGERYYVDGKKLARNGRKTVESLLKDAVLIVQVRFRLSITSSLAGEHGCLPLWLFKRHALNNQNVHKAS